MEIELDGIEELASLIAVLEALPGLLEKAAVGDGLLAAAQVVAKEAKASAAFQDRTGDLGRSIRARRVPESISADRRGRGHGAQRRFAGARDGQFPGPALSGAGVEKYGLQATEGLRRGHEQEIQDGRTEITWPARQVLGVKAPAPPAKQLEDLKKATQKEGDDD